jgi:hypothetical protein
VNDDSAGVADVIAERDTVLVPDTMGEPRYPDWSTKVTDLGLRSVLSVRLAASGSTLGVLQLFNTRRSPYSAATRRTTASSSATWPNA